MMYMGSKHSISKYIIPIMLAERKSDQWWIEPFVGGANLIDKIKGKRIGADSNPHTINALITIRDHIDDLPKNSIEFTEKDYLKLKANDDYPYKSYAGFTFSFGGKWLAGWCRGYNSKGNSRDYVGEAYRNAIKQSPKLRGVWLIKVDYQKLIIPPNSLIYCDPPYEGTTGYKNNFNHNIFWQWCRKKTIEGHTVFISESKAPIDFECIWELERSSPLRGKNNKKVIEKLFKFKGKEK